MPAPHPITNGMTARSELRALDFARAHAERHVNPAILARELRVAPNDHITRAVQEFRVEPHFNPTLNARELHFARTYSASHDGLLPHDFFWNDLEARFARDAARFAHYHPRIVGLLERDAEARFLEQVTPIGGNPIPEGLFQPYEPPAAPFLSGGGTTTIPTSPGGPFQTASVPEPSQFSLVGVIVTAAWFARRRMRRRRRTARG